MVNSRGIRVRIQSHCIYGSFCFLSASWPSLTYSFSLLPYDIHTFFFVTARVTVAAVRTTVMFLFMLLMTMSAFWFTPAFFTFSDMKIHTSCLIAVTGKMTWFSTSEASLVFGSLFVKSTFATSRVVLQFNFHFLSFNSDIVQSKSSSNIYSWTASLASSPSLYSMNANEYSLLKLFLTTTESSLP